MKLQKLFGGLQTDYLDGFQYKFTYAWEDETGATTNDEIKLRIIPTSEGYYDALLGLYIYNYVDHLGNVRIGYADSDHDGTIRGRDTRVSNCYPTGDGGMTCIDSFIPGEIVSNNTYYPFGMLFDHNTQAVSENAYKYKYNGKELQETGMYDYGARFYMPDIGRWGTQDPHQESYLCHSPYNYVGNNPIMRIDPDGRDWYYTGDGQYLYNKDLNRDNATQFFKDNNIEGARYAFASNTMGFMNYAADGYIYDDSEAGGGKPIENGQLNNIEGVTINKEPSVARLTWNFVADNIISKPVEGVQFFGYFFYGLAQVPGEMYKQGRMENIHVKMDMTLWGFKNGSFDRTMKYIDGQTVMTEQEKFEKIAIPGVEALTAGVAFGFKPFTKFGTIGNAFGNWGANTAAKAAVKKGIYQLGPKKDKR